ncbi:Cyclin B3 [Nesidiocoris tenuis]|uniref:Cyclin B3 n=1 Tax=Nesidiocoris tenuis TaxID=355587 RepID=A0ABN7B6H4_9HEMI|nr:Cyclin B3 [Nesidiocoris tenuis]
MNIGNPLLKNVANHDPSKNERRGKLENFTKPLHPYTDDYVRIMLKKEKTYLEAPRNFRTNTRARNIVVNWLVYVHHRYRLTQTVLHKTVALMDHYSSKKHVGRNRLQLIALSCTSLIVKKIGSPPQPSELVKMCASHFNADDLHRGEVDVLQIAKFDLNHPVSPQFLTIFQEYFNLTSEVTLFAQYFLDLWLFYQGIARHRGSVVASVAILFAMHVKKMDVANWRDRLAGLAHFSTEELTAMATAMSKIVSLFDYAKHPAILEKYPTDGYERVRSISQNLEGFDNFLNLENGE